MVNLAIEKHAVAVKGFTDRKSPLQVVAPLAATVSTPVNAGRVVHLNNSYEFELGASKQMPMFLLQGSEDWDVKPPGPQTASGAFLAQGTHTENHLSALVATGGFEIATTEFDGAQTYAINDFLRADANGLLTNQNSAGTGKVQPYGSDTVVGVVSRGVQDNFYREYDVNLPKQLYFWTIYLP